MGTMQLARTGKLITDRGIFTLIHIPGYDFNSNITVAFNSVSYFDRCGTLRTLDIMPALRDTQLVGVIDCMTEQECEKVRPAGAVIWSERPAHPNGFWKQGAVFTETAKAALESELEIRGFNPSETLICAEYAGSKS